MTTTPDAVHRFDFTDGSDEQLPDPPSPAAAARAAFSAPDTSPLDALEKALQEEVSKPDLPLKVPGRPGISVSFDCNIPSEVLEQWRKKSRRKGRAGAQGELDPTKLGCIVIAAQARSISINGELVEDDEGDPVLFYSPWLQQRVGSTTGETLECVRKFYGGAHLVGDGAIVETAEQIMAAAGYGGDEVEEADPTQATRL